MVTSSGSDAHVCRAHALVDEREHDSVEQVRRWLRIPSFSDTGEGIAACAEYTRDLLGLVCPDATVTATAGNPVVWGATGPAEPGVPTLLVYGLYDVTPTLAHEWTVDPLAAEIVPAETLGLQPSLGDVLVGRGAHNHKGPVLSAILAVKALLDSGEPLPARLVFVIEGEEEIGSPNLAGFVEEHREAIGPVAGTWLPCMNQSSTGVMSMRRAYKGSLFAWLECRGGEWGGTRDARHVWAGHSAWIDAPMMKLVQALASLFDVDQRLTLDGLEDFRPVMPESTSAEIARLKERFDTHPEWEQNMLRNLGVAGFAGGKRLSEHLDNYTTGVTLNIQGITGGYDGPSFYTMLPGLARAMLDFRFPPGLTPADMIELVHAHLDRRGLDMVRLTNTRGYGPSFALAEEDDGLLRAARRTAARYDVPIEIWPIANNCCPAALFTALGDAIPFSVAGMGYGDRPHAPDEYITVGSVAALMHFTVDFLHDWAAVQREAVPPAGR